MIFPPDYSKDKKSIQNFYSMNDLFVYYLKLLEN